MGGISDFSEELLIKILSYLPTKESVSTSVLSKRWLSLWTWVPNLDFGSEYIYDSNSDSDIESDLEVYRDSYFESLELFLLRNLPLYKAPVIESFCLNLHVSDISREVVEQCVLLAIERDVRELKISYASDDVEEILPSSLYTCKSLVTLELNRGILVEVPSNCYLPSLKTLQLDEVSYENKDSLQRLLYNCPVLEDLSLFGFNKLMIVSLPFLQRLSLRKFDFFDEFVVNSPSLTYLELCCYFNHLNTSFKNMPKLEDAVFEGLFTVFDKLIRSIQSVKCLTLCLTFDKIEKVKFDDGFVFNNLKHLKLCICMSHMSNVLFKLLKVTPNLRVLELFRMDDHGQNFWLDCSQPSTVPKCILSSLETFKWSKYSGSKDEREFVIYILQNAYCLKNATIFSYGNLDDRLAMKKELELSSRVSTTCQLLFH